MATNKHATIRYHALDRCFSNFGRRFFIEDLIDACNHAIYEFAGIEDGVKRRQVFDDITFMESEQGWSIPLERIKEGKRVYYRYSDKSFSIKNHGINQAEAEQLKETLTILTRFKGMPQFEWIEEMQIRLEDTFKLKGNTQTVVIFEQNPYLEGLSFFTQLFASIQHQRALLIEYKSFKQQLPVKFVFHPWFLKQYNNRWFLFGLNEKFHDISNLAIDRIISVNESRESYIPNTQIDIESYFEDVVGVTVKPETPIEKIQIKVDHLFWPYIKSKPIHGSQILRKNSESYVIIELNLQINHELIALLFSFMDAIEILEPPLLRQHFECIADSIMSKYI